MNLWKNDARPFGTLMFGTLALTTALLLMLFSSALSGQVLQEPETTSLSQSSDQPSNDSQKDKIKQFLMGELDNLIPGQFGDGSNQKIEIERAVDFFIEGQRADATGILKAQAAADPTFPPIELLQAGLIFGAGDAASGFKILEAASEKNPEYPGIYLAFARLAVSQSRFTDALALVDKAKAKLQNGSFSKTVGDHFTAQIYDIQIDIGTRRKNQDMIKAAMDGLQTVLPDNPKVILARAELAYMNKDYKASFRHLGQLHQSNPASELPEMLLASWFQRDGKNTETKAWITRAAETHPANAKVQLEFANYMVTLGEFPEAKKAIKRVEQAAGQELPSTLLLKAKIAFANEAYSLAEIHYEKLAKAQPKSFDLTNMYALCLIESDSETKHQKATTIAQRNYQQVPDSYVAQAALGWMMLRTGNKDQAKALFSRAARAPSLAPEVAYFLASYLHQSGSSQQAKLVLEPAMDASGLFLYRKPAGRLLSNLNDETQGSLPNPGQ